MEGSCILMVVWGGVGREVLVAVLESRVRLSSWLLALLELLDGDSVDEREGGYLWASRWRGWHHGVCGTSDVVVSVGGWIIIMILHTREAY